MFAVDGLIKRHELIKISELILGALQQYNLSPANTRVALVQYGNGIDVLHSLQNPDLTAIRNKVYGFSNRKGQRNIPKALSQIDSNIFQQAVRSGSKKLVFMFVAGPSSEVNKREVDTVGKTLMAKNIEVIFVYVGDHDSSMLQPLVRRKEDMMHVYPSFEIPFVIDPVLRMSGVRQGML